MPAALQLLLLIVHMNYRVGNVIGPQTWDDLEQLNIATTVPPGRSTAATEALQFTALPPPAVSIPSHSTGHPGFSDCAIVHPRPALPNVVWSTAEYRPKR